MSGRGGLGIGTEGAPAYASSSAAVGGAASMTSGRLWRAVTGGQPTATAVGTVPGSSTVVGTRAA